MKKKTVFLICIVLIGLSTTFLLLFYYGSFFVKTEQINIPELSSKPIVKTLIYENDSVVREEILFENTLYSILEFRNIYQSLKQIKNPEKNKFKSGFDFFSNDRDPVEIKNKYPVSQKINFKYYYDNTPISQNTWGDSIFIQRFENSNIQISLTEEKKEDIKIKTGAARTIIFYKKKNDLYLISISRFDLIDNKAKFEYPSDEELEKTIYPLVKNWGLYNKLKEK